MTPSRQTVTDEAEQQESEAPDPATSGQDGAAPVGDGPRRRRWNRRRWIGAAALAGGIGALYVAYGSPVTLVEHVVVEAPRGISEESVRLASGISGQDRVPAVDPDDVRLAVMQALPAVADVRVVRSLPSTIRLEITARTPLAAVAAGKGFYVVDAEGVVYDRVKSAKRLPVIRARTEVGRESARSVLLSLPKNLRSRVVSVSARTRDDVTLTLRDGAKVRWGSPDDSELKARVLAGLAVVKADSYDVSAPLLPTTSSPSEASDGSVSG